MSLKPKKPKIADPVPLVDENDPSVLRAREAALLAQKNRGGRASTILSSGGDSLGSTPGGAR